MDSVWFIEIERDGKWVNAVELNRHGQVYPVPCQTRDRAVRGIKALRESGVEGRMRIVRFKRHKEFRI